MLQKCFQNSIKKKTRILGSLLEGLGGAKGARADSKERGDMTTERCRGDMNLSQGDLEMWECEEFGAKCL